MRKRTVLMLLFTVLLMGCAMQQSQKWAKRGATVEEFSRDKYVCIQESRTSWSGGGSGLIGLAVIVSAQANANNHAQQLFRLCMEAHGWHVLDAYQLDPGEIKTIEEIPGWDRSSVVR